METLSEEIRRFCSAHGLRLNTDLGQHFLLDETILCRIVEAARVGKDETIVEIGPGIGILTRELLRHNANVIAIELDGHLIPLLQKFTGEDSKLKAQSSKLTIIRGNALSTAMPNIPYKVVANIPYHITSPLLRHLFLESQERPRSLTLLLQREVAEKICQPVRHAGNTKDAGMLTILVGLFGTPQIITNVPPEAFLPPPKVDSAVLHVESFEKPLASPQTIDRIFRLTKIAFGQKRKMLRNTLGAFSWGRELLRAQGIAEDRRPQTLSIGEWIALAEHPEEDAAV